MKNPVTLLKSFSLYGMLSIFVCTSACTSSRVAHITDPQPILHTDIAQPAQDALLAEVPEPAADPLMASADDEPAAAATQVLITAPVAVSAVKTTQLLPAQKVTTHKSGKLKTAATTMLMKTLAKKAGKAQKKYDIKKEKAAKAGKAIDSDVRTGILIGALGLLLIIVGAAIGSSLVYTLGGIGLTVGLIVIILAALDVI